MSRKASKSICGGINQWASKISNGVMAKSENNGVALIEISWEKMRRSVAK